MTDRTNGAAPGYVPRRALRIRVELGRQLGRRGVQLVLLAMVVVPCVLAGAISAGKSGIAVNAEIVASMATSSVANFTVFALVAGSQLGLVLMVAFVLGEAVARDAQWLHLRVLLTIPVPRGQLLWRKYIACMIVCTLGTLCYALVSCGIGIAIYGAGPLTPISGAAVPADQVSWRLAVMVGYLLLYLLWVGALALFMSVLAGDNPVAAVGGTVVVTLASHLLGGLPTLRGLREILPTRNYDAWLALTRLDVDWLAMQRGTFLSLAYTGAFLALAYARFVTRDVAR